MSKKWPSQSHVTAPLRIYTSLVRVPGFKSYLAVKEQQPMAKDAPPLFLEFVSIQRPQPCVSE